MKYFINGLLLIFIISLNSHAKHAMAPVVVSFKMHNQFVDSVVGQLQTKFNLPAPLIELRAQPNGCQKVARAILQICVLENEELELTGWDKKKWEEDFGEFGAFLHLSSSVNAPPLTTSQSAEAKHQHHERGQK